MKRPFIESFPHADDTTDSTLIGTNMYHDNKVTSPFHPPSESDYLSDDSKKPRKKRSAYQKIADDIRMQLLECVRNGETLKSAAKRFKINYSSAKSILHTFRKEGRILKKSAQERTSKKKIDAENEHPHKPQKHLKKEASNSRTTKSSSYAQKADNSFAVKPAKESNPLNSRKNSNCAAFLEDPSKSFVPSRKGSGFIAAFDELNRVRKASFQEDNNLMATKPHNYPNYEGGLNSMLGGEAHHQQTNFMYFPQKEYEPFHDMSAGFHHRNMQHDDFAFDPSSFLFTKTADLQFLLDDKTHKMDGGVFEENNAYDMGTLKNYMDTQSVYRTALRKASFFSSTSNGCRKSSFDMY